MHTSETTLSRDCTRPSGSAQSQDRTGLSLHTQTPPNAGLTSVEVTARRQRFGSNTLQSGETVGWPQLLLHQFTDVLILILFIAAGVSIAVGEWTDAGVILVIIVLNGLLGFVQEWKAERSLAALRNMLAPTCRVIRNGNEQEIEASQLVPGDIVRLETGNHVPADLQLRQCMNLQVDESALTGESVPVAKTITEVDENAELADRTNMAWMGTAVTGGRGLGQVTAIGKQTEFGRIATLTEGIERDATPLQQKLTTLGKQLGVAAIIISIIVAFAGWWMGKAPLEMFLTAVSLAVAVVPEGLPAVVTLTLALGVREMVRRKVLLRRLRAAEGLGAATVICTDKTGTLTQNQMTVRRIWMVGGEVEVTGGGYEPTGDFKADGQIIDASMRTDLMTLLSSSLRCNHAQIQRNDDTWRAVGEPTESALVVAATKAGLDRDAQPEALNEFSFSSTRKRMTVIDRCEVGAMAHTKGAPEVLLPRCSQIFDGNHPRPITAPDLQAVEAAMTDMAGSGLRTLAITQHSLDSSDADEETAESNLTLLGIVGMMDPPRVEAADAISLAHTAGIRVFMITGDSPVTATAIARQIGLKVDRAVVGSELQSIDDTELAELLNHDVVFARTTPEHKLRIVGLLQSHGHIVGMTGDGVNDAPALKKADIGIAMGKRGTDVAKGAADIVLTDDNFSSIVAAVEEGRRQYDNIQKFVRYLLSSNTGEVIAIFLNILLGGPLLFLPVQILWMNLVTDGLTAVALGLEPPEKNTMRRPPLDPAQPVLTGRGIALIAALGGYVGLVSLWLFHHYLSSGDPRQIAVAQTVAFTGIIVAEKINVLNFRSLRYPMKSVGFFTNPWVLVAVATTILLQVAAVYTPLLQTALHTVPLAWQDWLLVVAVSLPVFLIVETAKWGRSVVVPNEHR